MFFILWRGILKEEEKKENPEDPQPQSGKDRGVVGWYRSVVLDC